MWSTIERILTVLATGIIAYLKGREDVKDKLNENALADANARKDIEIEIAKSHSDPDARKRLRDKWHE